MSGYITVEVHDGRFNAYLAQPKPGAGKIPAIVVVQEIFGVNADLRATCDEWAAKGYLAISPDLFWRQEPGVDMSDGSEAEWRKGFELYTAFNLETGVADVVATVEFARSLPRSCGLVGVMGFCLGGLLTFLTAARCRADAAVAYYGGGMEKHLDEAPTISRPLLVHLGEEDEYILPAARGAIAAALGRNPNAEVFTYPGSRHAFARHGGLHFDAEAARLANGRTAHFFDLHLRSTERCLPAR